MPAIGQLKARHALWNRQQITQHERIRACAAPVGRRIGNMHPGEFRALTPAKAELDSPTEHHAGGDIMVATDRRNAYARLLRFEHDRELFRIGEAAAV